MRARSAFITTVALVVFVLAAAAFYFFSNGRAPQSTSALNPPVSETVTIAGKQFRVEDKGVTGIQGEPTSAERSAALALARALTTARRSPILDLEGTDPAKLRSAAAHLAEMQEKLADAQSSDKDRELVGTLYPISFLNALADLEEARQRFIASGADTDERVYETKLTSAINEGSKDIAAFKNAYDAVGHPKYALLQGIVDGETIRKELENIADGFTRLAYTVARRSRCFAGDESSCSANDTALADLSLSATSSAREVPESVTEAISILNTLPDTAGSALLELNDSACVGHTGAPLFFLLKDNPRNTGTITQTQFVGDLYFTTLGERYDIGLFHNLGVSYLYYDPLVYYNCLANGRDIAHAEGLVRAAELLGMSSGVTRESEVLTQLQKRIVNAQPEELNRILPAYLMLKDNSAWLDVIADNIARVNGRDFAEEKAGMKVNFSPELLFSVKSGFFDLFLAYNPSAGAEPFDISQKGSTNPFISALTSWSKLRGTISEDKIKADIATYVAFHLNPEKDTAAIRQPLPGPVSLTPPTGQKLYQNPSYGFALFYPANLSVSEHTGAGNSLTVLFRDESKNEGFQVFVIPYGQPKITQERFLMDEPSGVMQSPTNMTVGGETATKFLSTNQAMGATREVWFLHNALLYEVTAPQALDAWLMNIMKTWKFL